MTPSSPDSTPLTLEERLGTVARRAVELGLLLRDLHRDFPECPAASLLDLASSVVADGWETPPDVERVEVRVATVPDSEPPRMAKPNVVQ